LEAPNAPNTDPRKRLLDHKTGKPDWIPGGCTKDRHTARCRIERQQCDLIVTQVQVVECQGAKVLDFDLKDLSQHLGFSIKTQVHNRL